MLSFDGNALFWSVIVIQLVGLSSVVGARLCEQIRFRHLFQVIFFACLCLVGVATMTAVVGSHGSWLSLGVTLAIMSVGATIDLGNSHQNASI